jgi:hypothetical protein
LIIEHYRPPIAHHQVVEARTSSNAWDDPSVEVLYSVAADTVIKSTTDDGPHPTNERMTSIDHQYVLITCEIYN